MVSVARTLAEHLPHVVSIWDSRFTYQNGLASSRMPQPGPGIRALEQREHTYNRRTEIQLKNIILDFLKEILIGRCLCDAFVFDKVFRR